VDSGGNVFVTGYSYAFGTRNDYATVAYSSDGVPLWTNRYNGPSNDSDNASAMAVDRAGNVFVTGHSATGPSATIKYFSSLQAHLAIHRRDDQSVLSWTNAGFNLQSAPGCLGPSTSVPGAASPWTNPIAALQGYFRLCTPY
jgi:hypothetical protein